MQLSDVEYIVRQERCGIDQLILIVGYVRNASGSCLHCYPKCLPRENTAILGVFTYSHSGMLMGTANAFLSHYEAPS